MPVPSIPGTLPLRHRQRAAFNSDNKLRNMALAEIDSEQTGSLKRAIRGMAKHDGFWIMPNCFDGAIQRHSIHGTRLITGDVQPP